MSTLRAAAGSLSGDSHQVQTRAVDVSSAESVAALAEEAATLGSVTQVAHTAGLSPSQTAHASFITGTDPLVDGGVAGALRSAS
jgi:NAD(P)-dependent dehydrogenase (short-subunit alcohol dehydrogenase family)